MPVRKIPKNYLNVTGSFSSKKNGRMLGFESLLERDYMILLEFDEAVERFEEQPVKIPFKKGVKPYVPDLLIHYEDTNTSRPALAEVKHTSDLERNKEKYDPKFKQAVNYAQDHNWDFKVITEIDSRPQRLKTLKFLREYQHIDPMIEDIDQVINALESLGGKAPLNELLGALCKNDSDILMLVPTIWHLVFIKRIGIDYDSPIHDKTLLLLN